MSGKGVTLQRRRSSVVRRSSLVRSRRDSVVRNDGDAQNSSPLRRVDSDLLHLSSPIQRFWQVSQTESKLQKN